MERRKPNQEEWTEEEWINVSADELAGSSWKPTPSPSIPPTMSPTKNNIAIRFTQCSLLQVLHKEKSISGNVARQLPRRITINKGKERMMKEVKYTSAQMSLIDYQAMNTGSKKFRSSPYAQVHWAKHQGNQWYTEEKASKLDSMKSPKCRCYDKGKMETIRHVIQYKLRATIHDRKIKQFTELMRQVEMPNDILKLLEGGIDVVLSGGETYRGENWHDNDNIAQNDERIKTLLEDTSFREDAKEAFIQQMEMGWEDLFMGRMAIGRRSAKEKVKPWITKFMNLVIEWE